tara:strand:+ start:489 stop:641 length:153 start_codon:yes stop_codon:yes gene_type:complete
MSYVNRDQSGTVSNSVRKQTNDPIVERVMMIAQRLVAAEKEIEALKKKVK